MEKLRIEYNSNERRDSEFLKPIEFNFKDGEKILISPVGAVVGIDGRTFTIDGPAVVAATVENNVDLVFDVDHGLDAKHGSSAAGWIALNSLEARDDGIYGSLELTELGKELVDSKLYRYTSPAYIMDRNKTDRTVLAIDSVGLVNKPNLNTEALNSKESEKLTELNTKVENLEKENGTLTGDLETANKKVTELITSNTKLESDLKEANSKVHTLNIDLAIERNQIVPKDKEFCKSLEPEQLEKYISSNGSAELMKELNKKITPKEKNQKSSRVATAVQAGSNK